MRLTEKELLELAIKAADFAYVPYSKFRVGAALECSDGTVFTGCNVENSSYGATNCAERTAIFKAVSEGHRDFVRIAVYCADGKPEDYSMPCGICRQVMAEFNYDLELILGKTDGSYKVFSLKELLPYGSTPASLM